MVSADYYDAKIDSEVVYVDIEKEILWNARDADRGPSLSVFHGRISIDIVEQHGYVSYITYSEEYLTLGFHLSDLGRVCKHAYYIYCRHK